MKKEEPLIDSSPPGGMPETPVGRWVQPFAQFLKIQSASGFLLLTRTAIALLLANSRRRPRSLMFGRSDFVWQLGTSS